jgi:hypothetical protein
MDIEQYIYQIDSISDKLVFTLDDDVSEPFKIDDQMLNDMLELIKIKKEIITTDEISFAANIARIKPIIELNLDSETKLLLTSVYNEILNTVRKKEFIKSFEKYNAQQPIFQGNDLFNYVRNCNELIDCEAMEWTKQSNTFKYREKFLQTSFIGEELMEFSFGVCENYRKYIRIHPYVQFEDMPMMIIQEEALRPIDPHWIKTLKLYKGQSTGGHYFIPEINEDSIVDEDSRLKWWEHSIQGIKSLEVHAQRNNSGNLSMMIEEINEQKQFKEYYIAKCIHLDTDNDVGTEIDNAVLSHIDLAINVYDTNAFNERKNQSLADGRIVDATIRTHLIRFENVPFRILINLAYLFFDSQSLTKEWLSDQFS